MVRIIRSMDRIEGGGLVVQSAKQVWMAVSSSLPVAWSGQSASMPGFVASTISRALKRVAVLLVVPALSLFLSANVSA